MTLNVYKPNIIFLEYNSFYSFLSTYLTLVLNELERVTEDSESGSDSPGPILQELMAQGVPASSAGHLVSHCITALLRLRLDFLGSGVNILFLVL